MPRQQQLQVLHHQSLVVQAHLHLRPQELFLMVVVEAHKTAQAPQRQPGVQEAELTEQITQPVVLVIPLQYPALLFKVMPEVILQIHMGAVVAGQERLVVLVEQGLRLPQVLVVTALRHQ